MRQDVRWHRFYLLSLGLILSLMLAACASSGNGDSVDPLVERAKSLAAVQFYVTNQLSNTVSVVDIPNWQSVVEIEVGANPSDAVVSSDLRRVYVANQDDGTVSFISTRDLEVIETVEVGERPHAMALSPDNGLLFVPTLADHTVAVVDTQEAALIHVIELEEGSQTTVARFDPAGAALYVLSRGTHSVSVIDPETFAVTRTFSVGEGSEPQRLLFSADGSTLYVSLKALNQVAVLDPQTGAAQTDPIETQAGPQGLALSPTGGWLVVGNVDGNSVSIIDTADLSLAANVANIAFPQQIHFNREGSRFYVVSAGSNELVVIEADTWDVVDTIEVGAQPHDIKIKAPRSGGSCG